MKKIILIFLISVVQTSLFAQININNKSLENVINNATGQVQNSNGSNLPESEITKGLKEALDIGTKNAVALVSKTEGYYKNPKIKIPFPPEVRRVESTVRNLGMNKETDEFIKTLNKAAEDAAKSAIPVFSEAIKKMTLTDAKAILQGSETAATDYMKSKTGLELASTFKPIVQQSMQKVKVAQYWSPLAKAYNQLPLVEKANPDLNKYVTEKAIEGLFKIIAEEEIKIRKDPAARITDILKSVFGS